MIVMPAEINDAILGYLIQFFSCAEKSTLNRSSETYEKRKINVIHLLPALMAVLYAYIGTSLLWFSGLGQQLEGPFSKEENITATLFNLVYFIALVLIGTVILLILVKIKKLKIINIFYFLATTMLGITIYEIYLISVSEILNINLEVSIVQIIVFSLSLISSLLIFLSKNEKILFLLLTFYGGLTGPLFSYMLPLWSIFTISIALSLYDLYSVFKGPLKIIINEIYSKEGGEDKVDKSIPPIKGAIVPIGGLNIGLGDIVFYSLLVSASIMYPRLSYIRGFFVSVAILTGNYITLKLLEKHRYLPALPIPILLGIFVNLVFLFLNIL